MMKRKSFLLTLLVIVMIGAIIFIESGRSPSLDTPTTLNEEEIEEQPDNEMTTEEITPDDEDDEMDEDQEEDSKEQNLPERVFTAIQETISGIFSSEVNIVAIGDSLTQGVGDETDQGGYVGVMDRSLNHEDQVAHFENFGVRGNRSEQLLERLEQEEIQEAIEDADLILTTIGANDIMKVTRENFTNLQIEEFINERDAYGENLREIVDEMHELNRNAHIYLIGIFNPFEMYFEDIEELNLIVGKWNETSEAVADENEDITFIPIEDLFQDSSINLFADDNFHPNYHGYFLIAERVLEYITEEDE